MVLEYKEVYMLLGSNLGDREMMMRQAIERIEAEIGAVSARSSLYETAPWGNTAQPAFLNMAVCVPTIFSPLEVLEKALAIEKELGRVRAERWGSRTIDIDLIFYAADIVNVEGILTIPHPQMQNRRFVLEPLAEIAAAFVHPILNRNVEDLLQSLADDTAVKKYNF
jgi:2-amino-4-hydroxy-6-hydroxymethyldihydropteridine diphosphokinase